LFSAGCGVFSARVLTASRSYLKVNVHGSENQTSKGRDGANRVLSRPARYTNSGFSGLPRQEHFRPHLCRNRAGVGAGKGREIVTTLPLSKLRTDGGTQPRAALDLKVIEAYTEAMEAGAKFPPVDVFFDGTEYWLADGFHRERATFDTGADEIGCNIHQGTVEDAKWFSYAANKTNGLYRSNEDKQRAVKAALGHPKGAGMSDVQIARHVGVSNHCVSDWRAKLTPSLKVSKMATRTVTRKGKTYQQDTTNIGRRGSGSTQTVRPVVSRAPEPPSVPDEPEVKLAPVLVPPAPPSAPPIIDTLDPEDVSEAQRIVRLCEQITQSNLSAGDLRFVIRNSPWHQKAIETIKETCEYLQSSIGTAAATADTLSRN
jgi:hypothetical protein